MSEDLSPADLQRVQKHKLLQKFATVKKSHGTAILLCLGLGFVGAHRRYLGDNKTALAISIFWVIALFLALFVPSNSQTSPLIYLAMLYGVFILVELFRITGMTDRKNDAIKKSLEAEFYS